MDAAKSVQATFKPTAYFLFDTAVSSYGFLGGQGGREGADAMCAADPDRPAVCTTRAWAFISVSSSDEIRDMVAGGEGLGWVTNTSAPWYFSDGITPKRRAANSWGDLLDGSVINPPRSGGLDGPYWTGSTANGSQTNNCSNWGCPSPLLLAQRGYAGAHDNLWLSHTPMPCFHFYGVLCACM